MKKILLISLVLISALTFGQSFSTSGIARTKPYFQGDVKVKDTLFMEGKAVIWDGAAWQPVESAKWLDADGTNIKFTTGDVAIGDSLPRFPLHISTYKSDGGELSSLYIDGTYAATSSHPLVVNTYHPFNAGQSAGIIDIQSRTTGTNNVGHLVAYQSRIKHYSTGTIDNMYGGAMQHYQWGGVATNLYGYHYNDYIGDSVVTNQYAFYVAGLSKATNNWGIYVAGDQKNFMNGKVGIHTATYSKELNVGGSIELSQDIYSNSGTMALYNVANRIWYLNGGVMRMDTSLQISSEYITGDGDLEGIRIDATGQVSIGPGLAVSHTGTSLLSIQPGSLSTDTDLLTLKPNGGGLGDEARIAFTQSTGQMGYIGMAWETGATDSYMAFGTMVGSSVTETMRLDKDGDLTVTGTQTSFGELYDPVDVISTASAKNYTLSNWTAGATNNTTLDADSTILVLTAGTYLVNFSMSFTHSNVAVVVHISAFNSTDNTEFTNIETERKIGTGGDLGCVSGTGIIVLSANDKISLRGMADKTGNLTVSHGNLNIIKL